MFNVALYEPEIPPNTGNIIRLCANAGCRLHLIEPLGFSLDDKRMRRAGLDYTEWAELKTHRSWHEFLQTVDGGRIFAATTHSPQAYTGIAYQPGDTLLFGPETRGLPAAILEDLGQDHCMRIPMMEDSRSLNLSNSVAIILYEAWRQQDFTAGI